MHSKRTAKEKRLNLKKNESKRIHTFLVDTGNIEVVTETIL